jgi:hypothetical protein
VPRFITPENARDMVAKREAKKAERELMFASLSEAQLAKFLFAEHVEELARTLIQAALGQGRFRDLPPRCQLTALMRAVEWGIGKPVMMDRPEPEPDEPPGLEIS